MTKGTCSICGKTAGKAGMTRHLAACGSDEHGAEALVISVCDRLAPADYWLHVEAPASARLQDLDGFLRAVWLECCGHMSLFQAANRAEPSMRAVLGAVFEPGVELAHLYDMGSTTELTVRCLQRRPGRADGAIRMLARNQPPRIDCAGCAAPATTVCTECVWEGTGTLCRACAGAHACEDELFLPLVNSPRAGVCGYTGPESIAAAQA